LGEEAHVGIAPTDKVLQHDARRLLFDLHDPRNLTIAGQTEWLAAFPENSTFGISILPGHITGMNMPVIFRSNDETKWHAFILVLCKSLPK
jgi:hypothetical protein